MPTTTGEEARERKREKAAKRVKRALGDAMEWVSAVLGLALIIAGLVLAGFYIDALFSSPLVTLLATIVAFIAAFLILLLIYAATE